MDTIIEQRVSFIRKFGLGYKDAMLLFSLNPTSDFLEAAIKGDITPLVNWLDSISDNVERSEKHRIMAACLTNEIKFRINIGNFQSDESVVENSDPEFEMNDEYADMYGRMVDKEKYSVFREEKDRIENYSEEYLYNFMEQYVDAKCMQEWSQGRKLHRGRIFSEVLDALHVYDFYYELKDGVYLKICQAFDNVWNTVDKKRESYEVGHLDEWFDMYSKWLDKYGIKKCTKANIADFFKTISEVKMKTATVELIKNRYNSK